ncbi:hypothetical protein P9VFCI_089 [Rhizobium phage P9VFCI]|uniref:Uncharacterized protein n=1 Tax=Rhizobium phage P9VFCI TaxID=2763531 RepID=A0A7G7WXQ0_9CAUD|nr:hypothetical protein PP937_gp089 [Rhizobium phage P9VFCI]QNH71994.1 hypothetical protein P9VFCI_089 [Rhizobium phage P9VFCI]
MTKITEKALKEFAEQSSILEALCHSPSLGAWMRSFVEEHGNSLEDVRQVLEDVLLTVKREIVLRDDLIERNK